MKAVLTTLAAGETEAVATREEEDRLPSEVTQQVAVTAKEEASTGKHLAATAATEEATAATTPAVVKIGEAVTLTKATT